jgi:hypothetical protein
LSRGNFGSGCIASENPQGISPFDCGTRLAVDSLEVSLAQWQLTLVASMCATLLSGCGADAPSPTTPSDVPSNPSPSTPSPTISALVIVGVSGFVVRGQTVPLKLTATSSDGAHWDVTEPISWRSSSPQLVTISTTGVLQAIGVGDVDIVADYKGLSATTHVIAGYDLSGVIREASPLEDVPISDAQVEIVGGPREGQKVTTDERGRFAFQGITAAGFALGISKPGYETMSYGIVELPRDEHPSIALLPEAKVFNWHTGHSSIDWYSGKAVYFISISRTAPVTFTISATANPGKACNLWATYVDYRAALVNAGMTIGVSPDQLNPLGTSFQTVSQTAAAGDYQLSIWWGSVDAMLGKPPSPDPACTLSVTLTYR